MLIEFQTLKDQFQFEAIQSDIDTKKYLDL